MFIIVYITHPNEATAKQIVDYLLQHKTVACGNIFPITSAYWWQGKIEQEGEFVSIVKTLPKHWDTVVTQVKLLHPYETPCIMRLEATANAEYEEWIANMVKS